MKVQAPQALNLQLKVDEGELEAICLAREIRAAAVLMDDRAGRAAAQSIGLTVIGTVGLLEAAAVRGWLDLPDVLGRLRQTNVRLDPKLVAAALDRDKHRGTSET
jgi:predicted nucleic acid-binding protein